MQRKEWPINSTFNKHLLSAYQVPVTKDTEISLKIVPALEKLTVQQQRQVKKQSAGLYHVSRAAMEILSKGWWKHKVGRCPQSY